MALVSYNEYIIETIVAVLRQISTPHGKGKEVTSEIPTEEEKPDPVKNKKAKNQG